MSDSAELVYTYTFTMGPDQQKTVAVRLDPKTLQHQRDAAAEPPAWTALDVQQCEHCPLSKEKHPRCPAALSVVEVVKQFGGASGRKVVDVTIETEARRYIKRTSLQEALSSLLGLCMATSGCPVMGQLKPMVRLHMPFAKIEETLFRVLATYLLGQYVRAQKGLPADWTFKDLAKVFEAVHLVNDAFVRRLSGAVSGDACGGALSMLNLSGENIGFTVNERALEDLESLFASYLNDKPAASS